MPDWLKLSRKPSWPELRERVGSVLAAAHPDVRFALADPDADPSVGWHEGPAETRVAELVGPLPGWSMVSAWLGADPDAGPPSGPVLLLRRTFSERALALAVVRYRASHPRPYSAASDVARRRLWAILDEDDPARSGYPLTDAIADLLLASPDPDCGPEPVADPAERLARRLEAAGYDRLWNRAWASTPL
jgi:hypothetical protein